MNGNQPMPTVPSALGRQMVLQGQLTNPQRSLFESYLNEQKARRRERESERSARRSQYLRAYQDVTAKLEKMYEKESNDIRLSEIEEDRGLDKAFAALIKSLPPDQQTPVAALPRPVATLPQPVAALPRPMVSTGKKEHVSNSGTSVKTGAQQKGPSQADDGSSIVGEIVWGTMTVGSSIVGGLVSGTMKVGKYLASGSGVEDKTSAKDIERKEVDRRTATSIEPQKKTHQNTKDLPKQKEEDVRSRKRRRLSSSPTKSDPHDPHYSNGFSFPKEEIDLPPSDKEEHTTLVVHKSSGGNDKKRPAPEAVVPQNLNIGDKEKHQTNANTPTTGIRHSGQNKRSSDELSEYQSPAKRSRRK